MNSFFPRSTVQFARGSYSLQIMPAAKKIMYVAWLEIEIEIWMHKLIVLVNQYLGLSLANELYDKHVNWTTQLHRDWNIFTISLPTHVGHYIWKSLFEPNDHMSLDAVSLLGVLSDGRLYVTSDFPASIVYKRSITTCGGSNPLRKGLFKSCLSQITNW